MLYAHANLYLRLDTSSYYYSKTCVKQPLSKRPKIGFQGQLSLYAGQKYCRMLQEHSAILSTFIKLPFVTKIFVLSIFDWTFYTGFTVCFPSVQDAHQDSLDKISELEKKLDRTQYESKAKDEMMEDMKETLV